MGLCDRDKAWMMMLAFILFTAIGVGIFLMNGFFSDLMLTIEGTFELRLGGEEIKID